MSKLVPYKPKSKYSGRSALAKRPKASFAKRVKNLNSNPKTAGTGTNKVFAPLPATLGAKIRFNSDPLWNPQGVTGMAVTPGIVSSSYLFLNVLDMSTNSPTQRDYAPRAYWHNTEMAGLMALYQEFTQQMTYFRGNFHLDTWAQDPTANTMPAVQMVAAVVPLTYIKTTGLTSHIPSDSGTMFSGVDYYGMLTGMPGAQQCQLTPTGTSGPQSVSFKIDGWSHVEYELRGEATINNAFVDPNTAQVRTFIKFPPGDTLADQQVVLFAFRWLQYDHNQFNIRANLTIDQHYRFSDKFPNTQYLTYNMGTEFPDNR